MWILLAGWLLSAVASPDEGEGGAEPVDPSSTTHADPCHASPPRATDPFGAELERARALYRRGCHSFALDLLRALDARRRIEPVPEASLVKTLLYLGEVELVLGRREEARAVFESLLVLVPDASMNLLEHDPDAIDLFELVKARRPPPPALPPPQSTPILNNELSRRKTLTYVPYGIGHMVQGDRPRAIAYGGTQLAFGATMVVSRHAFDRQWPSGGPADGRGELLRAQALRGVNYGAFVGLLATYVISQVDTTRRWRSSQRAKLRQEHRREASQPDLSLLLAAGAVEYRDAP